MHIRFSWTLQANLNPYVHWRLTYSSCPVSLVKSGLSRTIFLSQSSTHPAWNANARLHWPEWNICILYISHLFAIYIEAIFTSTSWRHIIMCSILCCTIVSIRRTQSHSHIFSPRYPATRQLPINRIRIIWLHAISRKSHYYRSPNTFEDTQLMAVIKRTIYALLICIVKLRGAEIWRGDLKHETNF